MIQGTSPDVSRIVCCDRGYDRPSGRPRVFLRRAQDRLILRRTDQVRLGSNPLRLPGTRRKRLRCAWHTLLHGLVTAIRETSGLGVIKDVRTDRAKVGTFFAMKVGRRSKGEGCPRQRAQRDLHRRSFQFTKAGENQDESTF
jgi:hypothetical protein